MLKKAYYPQDFMKLMHIFGKKMLNNGKIIFFQVVMQELMLTQGDNVEHPFHGRNYKKWALEIIYCEIFGQV